MQTIADITTKRLEQILTKDKKQNNQILPIVKSDVYALLENFFVLKNLVINLEVENGEYILNIKAKASNIKKIGYML